jgi:pectate lyase
MAVSPRWLAAAVAAATTILVAFVGTADAATLFSDDFNDGDANGWQTSGGSWSVSSGTYNQSGMSADAKAQAGSTSWTGTSVQARVRPNGFGSNSSRAVGVAARAISMSSFYSLVLTPTAVQIRRGTTTLASTTMTISTGTFYTLRLETFGTTLRGFVNQLPVVSASDATITRGRAGFVSSYASGSFDDIVVTDIAGPGPTISDVPQSPSRSPSISPSPSRSPSIPPSPSRSPSPSPSNPNPQPNRADGFASVNALGQNGTSGGAGGPVTRVSTAAAFLSAINSAGPMIVEVNGMISLPGPMHDVASDKTIIGIGANSGISGGGLNVGLPIDDDITSPPANAVRNVIIRNLNLTNCPDDCINVQMFSHHIWIDHNDLSNQVDGALDVKRGSDYVTISWNHFHDSDKNSLVGHDDSNGPQDIGRLRISYHHNFFNGSDQRNPRVRFGEPVHIYNNYYLQIGGYGAASQMNAGLLVENNYFDGVEKPTRVDVGGDPGRIVARGNINVNTEDPIVVVGSVREARDFYAYNLDPAADIPAIVSLGAGTGRI